MYNYYICNIKKVTQDLGTIKRGMHTQKTNSHDDTVNTIIKFNKLQILFDNIKNLKFNS